MVYLLVKWLWNSYIYDFQCDGYLTKTEEVIYRQWDTVSTDNIKKEVIENQKKTQQPDSVSSEGKKKKLCRNNSLVSKNQSGGLLVEAAVVLF